MKQLATIAAHYICDHLENEVTDKPEYTVIEADFTIKIQIDWIYRPFTIDDSPTRYELSHVVINSVVYHCSDETKDYDITDQVDMEVLKDFFYNL